jgi:hypothetical protein
MPQKNKYNVGGHWITGGEIGKIWPIYSHEVTPGETWKGRSSIVIRVSPLELPAYMALKAQVNFFFVPHRLTFPEFGDVYTGADTSTAWPRISYGSGAPQDYFKAFGIPGMTNRLTRTFNALPFYAYQQVHNDWFRPHLQIGESALDLTQIHRCYFPESGYFSGIMEELQQGSEETIDTSGSTLGVTAVREAMNRQRFKERRLVFGERYLDVLESDFGTRPPDRVLDRSEHLCSGRATIGISEVVATASSTSEETGEMRGHGVVGFNVNFPARKFREHGTIIAVLSTRPRLQLWGRVDKQFMVEGVDDLYNPSYATDNHVVVKGDEIYPDTAADSNFGYQFRDQWLRTGRDTIAGRMLETPQLGWTAPVALTGVPTVAFLKQVQDYDTLFQDQSPGRMDLAIICDHKLQKFSPIRKIQKRMVG